MISLPSLSVALSLLFLLPVAFSNDSGLPSFSSSSSQVSNGKNARCEVGTLNVNVEAQNVKLVYDGPANQTILTATFNDLLAAGSTLGVTVQGGPSTVRDTYAINAQLCFPASANPDNVKTVQLLTHGGSLNSLYWDLQQNSYVDAATVAGYATLAYDRLGAGKSERPDPVQVVQASVEVEISHLLTQALRNGAIDGKHNFNRVIGTSHSSGNILTIGQAVKYPNDFDALVVTGFTINGNYMPPTLAAGAYEPAAASGDPRFAGLPNGYYVQATPQSIQFLFFKFPNYDQKIFDTFVTNKDIQTIGELFTLGSVVAPNPKFTGPVDVVAGENDFIFCGSNCSFPSDQTAMVQPALFPAAAKGSQHYIVPGSGHNINAHNGADQAYAQILRFLEDNSFAPENGKASVQ